MGRQHERTAPAAWVTRFAGLIRPGGIVLDLASGSGRHAIPLLDRGYRVVAVDVDVSGLADLAGRDGLEIVAADLESAPWPFDGRRFDGIVVTNYLYRPLFPRLVESLAAGGVLIYQTFALGNARFGRPRNPDHLLRPGELLAAFDGPLRVIAFEQGMIESPRPAVVQRICAGRTAAEETEDAGWPLQPMENC